MCISTLLLKVIAYAINSNFKSFFRLILWWTNALKMKRSWFVPTSANGLLPQKTPLLTFTDPLETDIKPQAFLHPTPSASPVPKTSQAITSTGQPLALKFFPESGSYLNGQQQHVEKSFSVQSRPSGSVSSAIWSTKVPSTTFQSSPIVFSQNSSSPQHHLSNRLLASIVDQNSATKKRKNDFGSNCDRLQNGGDSCRQEEASKTISAAERVLLQLVERQQAMIQAQVENQGLDFVLRCLTFSDKASPFDSFIY